MNTAKYVITLAVLVSIYPVHKTPSMTYLTTLLALLCLTELNLFTAQSNDCNFYMAQYWKNTHSNE
jgi:hypothetical protein